MIIDNTFKTVLNESYKKFKMIITGNVTGKGS